MMELKPIFLKLFFVDKCRLLHQAGTLLSELSSEKYELEQIEILHQKLSKIKTNEFFSGRNVAEYDFFLEKSEKNKINIRNHIKIKEKKLYEIHKKLETAITKIRIANQIKIEQYFKWKKKIIQQEVAKHASCLES
ncbi:MAG: hypothetical protein RRZ67_01115 [Victivallaceae bacterium]